MYRRCHICNVEIPHCKCKQEKENLERGLLAALRKIQQMEEENAKLKEEQEAMI